MKKMNGRIRKAALVSLAGAALGLGPLAVVAPAAYAAGGASGADSAALSYVQANYGGSGTSQVLKTEPDVDKGVPVYDVRTLAPNGTVYVVQVAQSNDAVVSASVAEGQTTTAGATSSGDAPDHAASASGDVPSAERGDASEAASGAPAGTAVTSNAALLPAGFSPFWVQSFAPSVTLWSGSDNRAVAFGNQGQGSAFLVVRPQAGSRLFVYNPLTRDFAYVNATSVGPGPAAA